MSSSVGSMAGPDGKVARRYDPTPRFGRAAEMDIPGKRCLPPFPQGGKFVFAARLAPVVFGQHVVVKQRWRPAGAGRIHDTQLLAGIRFITIKSCIFDLRAWGLPLAGYGADRFPRRQHHESPHHKSTGRCHPWGKLARIDASSGIPSTTRNRTLTLLSSSFSVPRSFRGRNDGAAGADDLRISQWPAFCRPCRSAYRHGASLAPLG